MLHLSLLRLPNIKTTIGECLVFAGKRCTALAETPRKPPRHAGVWIQIPSHGTQNSQMFEGLKKYYESGFRSLLCTYRLNWARRTSWGWWDEWDDTALQTQDSKFKPWRSEVEHATSRSRRLPTILYEWMGKKHFCYFQTAETGKRTLNSSVKGSDANHYLGLWALSTTF